MYVCVLVYVLWNVSQLGGERHHGKLSGVAMPLRILSRAQRVECLCIYTCTCGLCVIVTAFAQISVSLILSRIIDTLSIILRHRITKRLLR